MREIEFLGCKLHVGSMHETVELIKHRLIEKEFTQHCVVNVAKLVHMQRDAELRASVEACDLINIDGMGIVFGARMLGHAVPERVAGVDLFSNLIECAALNSFSVFLLGARQETVEKVANRLANHYPSLNIAGYHHGYFWDNEKEIVERIRISGAQMLFVAITSPKKESFINRWKQDLGVDFVMGVGGTFDVVAGITRRAPSWMQNCGAEWLFRVLQEPRRMWRRYLVTNSKYAAMIVKARFAVALGFLTRQGE